MQKTLAKILVCLLLLGMPFTAMHAEEAPAKLQVVTTIFAPYDFVRQIAGDAVDVSMLLPPGSESHSFEPTPQDILKIQNSDVFVYVGGENDIWVDRILESMDTDGKTLIRLVELVETVPEEIIEGMEHGHEHEDDHEEEDHEAHEDEEEHHHDEEEAELDEHVWTSPLNAITIVQALADTLSGLDTQHAAAYQENVQAYIGQLESLHQTFTEIVENGNRKLLIFGDRFPFRYLADAYGLSYYAAFAGCSTDTEASAQTIAFLIDKTAEEQVPVVFTIELSNGRIADTICESTDAKKLEMHSAHNVTKNDFEAGITYLDIMLQNAEALKEALQ